MREGGKKQTTVRTKAARAALKGRKGESGGLVTPTSTIQKWGTN